MRPRTVRRSSQRGKNFAASSPQANRSAATSRALTRACTLVLATVTLILYYPVSTHDFINYDDDAYVVNNPYITPGLTWQTVRWSLTSTGQANWHPLTWLSHALDCQLFGLNAGYHHLTSVFLHALNVVLLFWVLQRATGLVGRSFVVAAVFAWHPFNVQSVAWVAERKNVLCTFFFLLCLLSYIWHARRPRWQSLTVVTVLFALALTSKPMAVTLPFVLLLFDYWPLHRVTALTSPDSRSSIPQQPVSRLLLEKLPLFVLSAASSAITVWAQRSGGALRTMKAFPFTARLQNALDSYVLYIWKTFVPHNFALFYPHPGSSIALWKPALAAIFLFGVSFVVWQQRATRPYLIVGWLWFLGTLFLVIGIVQVGDQAMADRYAYLPTIGPFLMAVWGISEIFDRTHLTMAVRSACAVVMLAGLCFLTSEQLKSWTDSIAIWTETLRITPRNSVAERKLAFAFSAEGHGGEAMIHLTNAVNIDPGDVAAHVNLGSYYAAQNRLQEGMREFEAAVALTDGKELSSEDRSYRSSALLNLGYAYTMLNDYSKALKSFQGADQFDPSLVSQGAQRIGGSLETQPSEERYLMLSLILNAKGKKKEASSLLENVVKENPGYSRARDLLTFLEARS